LNRRPKACQIIPSTVYDNLPPIVFEDDKWRYILGPTGHFTRLRRKICFSCSNSGVYAIIFNYKKHNRVERFCVQHAQELANNNNEELPEIPKLEESSVIAIANKKKIPKISSEAIQKWNRIKI
jgi:hypothetical protein